MIAYWHADPRFPFLRETAGQPAGRWNREGSGPVQYLTSTPDGAWAELLRHEDITEAADVATVDRSLWAVEVPEPPDERVLMDDEMLLGGIDSWYDCQHAAEMLARLGEPGFVAPSAALIDGPSGWRVAEGMKPGWHRREWVIVLFGPRPDLHGWRACEHGRPSPELLGRVRPLLG